MVEFFPPRVDTPGASARTFICQILLLIFSLPLYSSPKLCNAQERYLNMLALLETDIPPNSLKSI